MAGPLSHLKVLDLSRVLAGPWAGQILADLGADVIKVERPGTGDDTRGWGPPYLKDAEGRDTAEAAYYLSANRNKRSLALDMADPRGQAIVKRLAGKSDVLIENFKAGGLKKYGLDYESLAEAHPGLVYCSITGFGQEGPEAGRAGYDFIIQGMAGLMSITGFPETPPVKVGVAISDLTTGMYAVIAIQAALVHRDRTGQGQHIDMALFDTQLGWLANQNMNWLVGGRVPGRQGNAHPNIVPYQEFATADGHLIVAAGNDRQFVRLCQAIGADDIGKDPAFATNAKRVAARAALAERLGAVFRHRPTAHWLEVLSAVNVPHGPVQTIAEAFATNQARARGLRVDMEHPAGVALPTVASPMRFSHTPVSYRRPPPMLGEHSDAVLGELGLSAEEIAALKAAGVAG